MQYKIFFTHKAEKQYNTLTRHNPKLKKQFDQAITDLEQWQGNILKLTDLHNNYRLRVNNYRLIFSLESDTIYILEINDRKEAYKKGR